ncbi:MAG TPA: hypothetical protein VKN76_06195 [Kiloniellaceae bacterium]|nr:hypothetical protein [Kiloniellaceae bacterium]
MKIDGSCHCGNITFTFDWPGTFPGMAARVCSCGFCQRHGGTHTSHPDGALTARIAEPDEVNRYEFGTKTATFYVCRRCGVEPFVTSEIDGHLYAVVNVNCFEGVDREAILRSDADFEDEDLERRLARRAKTWIAKVNIAS